MYRRPLGHSGGRTIFLATPTMKAPHPSYTYSLGQTMRVMDNIEHALYVGDCHVDDARNRLVRDFLESDCDELVFIDDDIGWEPDDLAKLLSYDRDIVAATYPYKQDDEGYPVAMMAGDNIAGKDGLLEVSAVPTGFLRIKRHVLQTLADKAPWFYAKSDSDFTLPLIFERQIFNGHRRGGDYAFCHKAREAGFEIHLDPEISLSHSGDHTWHGSWGHWKRCDLYGPLRAGIIEIQHGLETGRTSIDLVKAWGNDWSSDATLIDAAIRLAKLSTEPILEFGSGLTTLAMAAANKFIEITAIEHDKEWADRTLGAANELGLANITIHNSQVEQGYYTSIPDGKYGLVLADGPPRQIGKRERIFEQKIGNAVLLMDDLDCPVQSKRFYDWSTENNRDAKIVGRVGISKKAA